MLNFKEIMNKIDVLECATNSSQTIGPNKQRPSSGLNPSDDLSAHIYEEIIKSYPDFPVNVPIKQLRNILAAEFYKEQTAQMASVSDFKIFYQSCKSKIDEQFVNHPDKARFLHLMIMLELIAKPETPITNDHISVAFQLFQKELNNKPEAKKEFEDYFSTGKMMGFNNLDQFIKSIESYLTPNENDEQEASSMKHTQ